MQELVVSYQHELEAYLSTPKASDLFSLLRARLRADPTLTQRCFDTCATDTDKNALTGEQVRRGCWGRKVRPSRRGGQLMDGWCSLLRNMSDSALLPHLHNRPGQQRPDWGAGVWWGGLRTSTREGLGGNMQLMDGCYGSW